MSKVSNADAPADRPDDAPPQDAAAEAGKSIRARVTPRGAALVVAALFAAGLATLTALNENRDPAHYTVVLDEHRATAESADPLMDQLIRCRALPPEAIDIACQHAWDENRRRFFGETRATRVPGDPLPAYAPIPALTPSETPPARTASAETVER
jgi:conjugative transfer region protein TrbK